jgi:hypothetical protein
MVGSKVLLKSANRRRCAYVWIEGGRQLRRPPTLLVVELFGRDYAGLRIGVKVHLLAVLDAFAFPSTVIGFKLGNLGIAGLEDLLLHLLGRHPVWPRLIGPCQV